MSDLVSPHSQAAFGAAHMQFAAGESAALRDTRWERWVAMAEQLLGHDLDGDDSADAQAAGTSDGYSLDGAYDDYRAGMTVHEFVAKVVDRKKDLAERRAGSPASA